MNQFRLVVLVVLTLVACSQSAVKPTITSFTATPSTVTAGGAVRLEWQVIGASSLSVSPDVGVVTGTSTTVIINQSQSYTLTASNNVGSSQSSVQVTLQNLPTNRAPVAAFTTSSLSAMVNDTLGFDASTSSDPDGDTLTHAWTFGDTTNASGVTTSHAYLSAGSFTVTLTVSDGRLTNSISRSVSISSTTPASQWQRLDTGSTEQNASFFQRLRVASNARGDAAAIWEEYPSRLRLSVYTAATDSWDAVKTFQQTSSFLQDARVRVLPDGTVIAVWLETPISGAAQRWRFVKSNASGWDAPTDILTLDSDVQLTFNLDLLVNEAGRIAFAWQVERVTAPGYRRSYVSTQVSSTGWLTEKLGDDEAGPPKITLDHAGTITALYGSRTNNNSATFSVFSKRYTSNGWATPVAVLTTNNRYSCANSSSPCYAVSTGQNGKTVALLWDAVGTFSGQGTVTSRVWDELSQTWLVIADPIAINTNLPLLRSDANGHAIAVYQTANGSNTGLLTSRRFDASTDTWTAERTREGVFAKEAQMNSSGEVFLYGEVSTPQTISNLGADWSTVISYDDISACGLARATTIALDDNGFGLIAQLCETPSVGIPMFVRAKRFSLR